MNLRLAGASTAVRAAMRGNDPTGEQWLAISHPPEPLAIIAGAGSGKTAIMAARMVWMVEEGIARPSQILGLTFTNKAARKLEERIELAFAGMDPPPTELPTVSTYNSFADRIVRQEGVRVGVDPESSLLSQAQTWQLLAESLNHVEPFDAIDSRSIASLTKMALGLADQCANNYVTPEQVAAEDRRIIEREAAYERDVLLNSGRRRARPGGPGLPGPEAQTPVYGLRGPGDQGGGDPGDLASVAGGSGSATRPSCWTSTRTPTSPSGG